MKVLIISHNPMSTYNGMGRTVHAFFSEFAPGEICQFYIYPSLPDVEGCRSYYRVTDKEVLSSLFTGRLPGGKVSERNIGGKPMRYEHAEDQKLYADKRNKRPVRILLRDAMWKCSCWYHPELSKWLAEEQPECIFLAPGRAKFIYDAALKISEALGIPMVTYIADEYYFIHAQKAPLGRLQQHMLRKKMRRVLALSSHVVTISRELEELYHSEFGCAATTIMTGSNRPLADCAKAGDSVSKIAYFGNLANERYRSLVEIGKVVEELNAEQGTQITLDIFSDEADEAAVQAFHQIRSIRYHGFVTGDEFTAAFYSADMLVHVEAFDQRSVEAVRYSVSTKIADSLASGIPVLAYGPECVASVRHLTVNECAFVATSSSELKKVLTGALDRRERVRIAERALRVADEYHNRQKNSLKLKAILAQAGGRKNE